MKKRRTCPRNYLTKTPAAVKNNRALCCRVAGFLNDLAVDVVQGAATPPELDTAWRLALDLGVAIKGTYTGSGPKWSIPGRVDFDCNPPKGGKRK